MTSNIWHIHIQKIVFLQIQINWLLFSLKSDNRSPIFESFDLFDNVMHLAAIEVCSVVIAKEYVIQFFIVEFTHHLTPHSLPLRSRPIFVLVFKLIYLFLLLAIEIFVFLRSCVNAVKTLLEFFVVFFVRVQC